MSLFFEQFINALDERSIPDAACFIIHLGASSSVPKSIRKK